MLSLLALTAYASWTFDSGSDGSFGPILVSANTTLEVPLPPDGIIHATTITVESGGELTFTPNQANTPVYLLAQGDVVVDGTIDVSGQPGYEENPGIGGPNGGRGGWGNLASSPPRNPNPPLHHDGRAGLGLAGGRGGYADDLANRNLCGGGGGGGAIVIGSSSRVEIQGSILAHGGSAQCETDPFSPSFSPAQANSARGGAIRVVSPTIEGTGTVSATNGNVYHGSIRYDYLMPGSAIGLNTTTIDTTAGHVMVVLPPSAAPEIHITSVGTQQLPTDTGPINITIPEGESANQLVTARITGYPPNGIVRANLWMSNSSGDLLENLTTNVDLSQGNEVTFPLTFDPMEPVLLEVAVAP